MFRAIQFVLAAVALFGMSAAAQATIIPSPGVTAGATVVFQSRSFEDDTVNTWPSVALTGSWFHDDGFGNPAAAQGSQISDAFQVVTAGSGGVPAAAPGNGAKLLRYADLTGYDLLKPNFQRQPSISAILSSTISTGTVSAEFSLYADSFGSTSTGKMASYFGNSAVPGSSNTDSGWAHHGNFPLFIFVRQLNDFLGLSEAGLNQNDVALTAYNETSWGFVTAASGGAKMVMTADAWHTVKIDATLGTGGTYTMTLDGVVSNPIALKSGATVRSLTFGSNDAPGTTRFYIDGVPEPSTIVLLGAGLLGLLAYAWRKRR